MPRVSIKGAVKTALQEEKKALKAAVLPSGSTVHGVSTDSFQNYAQKMGIGTDNPLSTAGYGYNPITRNRVQLEWIHRGSWLGGAAIDIIAEDMTRAGVDITTEMPPDQIDRIESYATALNIWGSINEVIKWGRLYGGAIAVMMIDGQDPRTPLNIKSVGPGQFKGLLVLDRWMVEPALEDLVTDMGPYIGLPKYYRVQSNAPALRGIVVHYSRVAIRYEGVQLPYSQRLTENLWGVSILERIFDRMVSFDTATTGAAQLVHKAYLRTMKIKGMREIIAAGGPALNAMIQSIDLMRRYQGIEGISIVDAEDEFQIDGHQAFSGLSDALSQFGQQLSGALEIPLTRLFGQSPGGFSDGDNNVRQYYDGIHNKQNKQLKVGTTLVYRLIAQSASVAVPPGFGLEFSSLWDLTEPDKATTGKTISDTVSGAFDAGLIGRRTALKEMRQSSKVTGMWSNITQEMIAAADDEVAPPQPEGMMPGMPPMPGTPAAENAGGLNGNESAAAPGKVAQSTPRTKLLPEPARAGGQASPGNRPGPRA